MFMKGRGTESPSLYENEKRARERAEAALARCREELAAVSARVKVLKESEACYRGIFSNMTSGMALYRPLEDGLDFVFINVNPAGERMDDISARDVIGRRVTEVFPGVESFGLLDIFRRVAGTGVPEYYPSALYRDERLRVWRDNRVYKLPSGEIAAIYDDITERVRLEEERERNREFLQTVVDGVTDGLMVINRDYTVALANRAALETMGEGGPLECLRCHQVSHKSELPCDGKTHPCPLLGVMETGKPMRVEHVHPDARGEKRNVELIASPIFDKKGEVKQIIELCRDVTERRRTEEAVKINEERLEMAMSAANDGMVDWDMETGRIYFDRRWYTMTGHAPGEYPGTPDEWKNRVHRGDFLRVEAALNAYLAGETETCDQEYRFRHKGGEWLWIRARVKIMARDGDGALLRIVGTHTDITRRKRRELLIEAQLRLSEYAASHSVEELQRAFLDEAEQLTGSEIGFYHGVEPDQMTLRLQAWSTNTLENMCSAEGVDKAYSTAEAGVWGDCVRKGRPVIHNDYRSLPHRRGLPEGHAPVVRELVVPVFRGDRMVAILGVGNKKTDYTGEDVEIVSDLANMAWDIVARKQAEVEKEQLLGELEQSRKMEAVGTLAGGIAHDFNNILAPILGYSQMLAASGRTDAGTRDKLEKIHGAALRAKELVGQILAFSRRDPCEKRPMPMEPVLKEALKLIRSSIPASVRIRADIAGGGLLVNADPTQVHQVIMNLSTNAWHAMEKEGGELRVRFEAENSPDKGGAAGAFVRLTVADTGTGMGEALMEKVFEPFFTTKAPGKGTGMGLSVVHGIVKSMGGTVGIHSRPGEGTRVTVRLPALPPRTEPDVPAPGGEPVPGEPACKGSGHILLVDDEEAVLTMETIMLETLGYRVSAHMESRKALSAFRKTPEAFDLVVTDMGMPDLPGDRLAREIAALRPGIPILLCSGFSEEMEAARGEAGGVKAILMKPFRMEELGAKIVEALGH